MNIFQWIVLIIVAMVMLPPIIRGINAGIKGDDGKMICPACGSQGEGKKLVRGSFLIEIVLWLCFLVPGLIYTLWRMSTTTYNTCPACQHPGMIPLSTPNGQRLAAQFPAPKAAAMEATE